MIPIGRIGDQGIGTCTCHRNPTPYVTTIISGSPDVLVNGLPAATVGSIGVASCGHTTIALTGSFVVLTNSTPTHRLGDSGQNCGPYTLITGSFNTLG